MLKIEQWASGKPVVVAKVTQSLVLKSDVFQEFDLFLSHFAKLDYFQDLSNLPEWFSLYRDHKRVSRGVISALRSVGGLAGELADVYEYLLILQKKAHPGKETKSISEVSQSFEKIFSRISETVKSNQEVRDALDRLKNHHQEDMISDLSGEITDEEFERIREVLNYPEFLFFLKIKAPCVAFYMEHPSRLYRNARLGDINSWDKLVRIDKFLLSDPTINRHLSIASDRHDYLKLNKMLKAIEGAPRKKSPQFSKLLTAGLISIFSEVLGYKLNSTAIRELFDAAAVDSGRYEQIDEDLPSSPEAFSQGILRVKKLFNFPSP